MFFFDLSVTESATFHSSHRTGFQAIFQQLMLHTWLHEDYIAHVAGNADIQIINMTMNLITKYAG